MESNKIIYIYIKEKSDANFGSSQVCESFKEKYAFSSARLKKGKINSNICFLSFFSEF